MTTISGGVVILSAENGLGDTIRPRLEAAGADLGRIVALRYTSEREGEKTVCNIPGDIPTIQAAIERVGAKLVIVDVLMAYLPSQTNTYRDQDVRLALAPFAEMAARTGVAVICIRHLTKAPGANPMYRGGGSIGIIGGARAGLLVAKDPEDPSLIVLAQTKSNLGPAMPSLAYRIEANSNGVPRIAWKGESGHTAVSLLAATVGQDDDSGARIEAKNFLLEELANGPRKQSELIGTARKAGISDATLRRAKRLAGVKSHRVSQGTAGGGYWVWELQDAHIQRRSMLQENGGSEDGLTPVRSIDSCKVLKMPIPQDVPEVMSTLREVKSLPLAESDWGEV